MSEGGRAGGDGSVTESVYLLWFVQERKDDCDIELLIGIYATETDAQRVIERLKSKPGFVNFPQGLEIHRAVIGQTGWEEGYVEA
jgi:hypothetical protein